MFATPNRYNGFDSRQGLMMRYLIAIPLLVMALLLGSGCSSESNDPQTRGDHVFEGQVEAIDKARDVETMLKRKQGQQQGQQP
jgi:hypothetical protein